MAQDRHDCASFDSPQESQRVLDLDPDDPSNLDADNDGMACEDYPCGDDGGGADDGQYSGTPPSDVNNPNDVVPNTGGPPYLATGALKQ